VSSASQARQIYDLMMRGQRINPEIAEAPPIRCKRLAARINDIKNGRHGIPATDPERRMVSYTNAYGEKKRYAEYWINTPRQQGQLFAMPVLGRPE
jgi:hypothetical protein